MNWAVEKYNSPVSGTFYGLGVNPNAYTTTNAVINSAVATKNGLAIGYPDRLSIVKRNAAHDADGAVAFVTSDYNSGYQLGDIRLAALANGGTSDRSVKGNSLTTTGSIAGIAVATNAELVGFSGFSASNYLSRANDTDFDFGTGDFSIMFWCKSSTTGSTNDFIGRGDATPEAGDFFIRKNSSEKIQLFRHTGTSYQSPISASSASIGTSWSQVVVTRKGTTVSIYVNGKLDVSGTWSDTFTPSGGSAFTIGLRLSDTSVTGQHMSLSLVRISATAPTPQQVKEIYEAERPLFRAGAKCLLQHSTVRDLSYDSSTELLAVGQTANTGNEGVTFFKGLENVKQLTGSDHANWDGDTVSHIATVGGIVAYGRIFGTGGVIVDIPPFDVRGDTNIADSKLPDDGKIHFSAAISDSNPTTPTVIGVLPMAEGETYYITARVFCKQYIDNSAAVRASYVIEQKFRRPIGGNATAATPMSVLRDEGTASMDAVFSADTGSQQIRLTVTGVANTRSIWSAELDVERITERSYER